MAEGTLGGTKISDLPRSSFAYCEPKGGACHFPIRDASGKPDAAHVRNALARLSSSPFEAQARPKVEAAAKELGIGAPAGKAMFEMKAEAMTTSRLDKWLAGNISRRILMLPFGGPIPSEKSSLGVDLDGEWFDEDTDIYGPHPFLRTTRERVVDWHHDDHGVPVEASRMKGAILGRVIFDADPSDDGYWADWWANAGENRRRLIAMLEKRNVPLYGSTQAVASTIRKADTGHLDVWPVYKHTISTSPQNTYAVVPPLKALLDGSLDDLTMDALKAFLVGVDDQVDLRATFPTPGGETSPADGGELAAKAGRVLSARNEQALRRVMDELSGVLDQLIREAEGEEVLIGG